MDFVKRRHVSVACGIGFALACLFAPLHAQPSASSSNAPIARNAEHDYQILVALEKSEPPNRATMSADALNEWWMARNLELHEAGLAFLDKYPAHPLRWEVVFLLRYAVNFSRDVVLPNGERKSEPDLERMRVWRARHREMLLQLLEAPDASPKARIDTLRHLISVESMNIRDSSRPTQERMSRVLQWLERFERETGGTWGLSTLYLHVANALNRLDAERCLAFITEKRAQHASASAGDVDIRTVLDGRLRALLAEAEPLWVRLRALDGRFADTQMYRGKVVLIAIFPVTWYQNAEFLEELYKEHHAAGLEVIQITNGENRDEIGRPLGPLEVALKVEDKQWPWPVVWDRQGVMGQFARALGIRSEPTWLLLARDGRLVTERVIRSQVAAEIKRELSLPTAATN